MMTRALLCFVPLVLAPCSTYSQRCPDTVEDIFNLNPLTACLVTATVGLNSTEAAAYFDSSAPQNCVTDSNACSTAVIYEGCANSTAEIINFVAPQAAHAQCSQVLKTLVAFCTQPFGNLVMLYCHGPLIPTAVTVAICAGSVLMVGVAIFIYKRTKKAIHLEHEIENAVGPGRLKLDMTTKQDYQESSNPRVILSPKKSSYRGVEWNLKTGGWDAIYATPTVREVLGNYPTQQQAAEKYDARVIQLEQTGKIKMPLNSPKLQPPKEDQLGELRTAQNSSHRARLVPPHPPGLGYSRKVSVQNEAADRQRHIDELIEFYRFHDPDRPDLEANVIDLFEKYSFRGIARALLRKYGALPAGWQSEYDAGRSIAMSMAYRVFGPNSTSSQIQNTSTPRKGTLPSF